MKQKTDTPDELPPPQPKDVIDGIPDRAARRPRWQIVAIFALFAAWIAFLLICQLIGR